MKVGPMEEAILSTAISELVLGMNKTFKVRTLLSIGFNTG